MGGDRTPFSQFFSRLLLFSPSCLLCLPSDGNTACLLQHTAVAGTGHGREKLLIVLCGSFLSTPWHFHTHVMKHAPFFMPPPTTLLPKKHIFLPSWVQCAEPKPAGVLHACMRAVIRLLSHQFSAMCCLAVHLGRCSSSIQFVNSQAFMAALFCLQFCLLHMTDVCSVFFCICICLQVGGWYSVETILVISSSFPVHACIVLHTYMAWHTMAA